MTPNEGPTNSSGAKFMEQKMFLSVNYICLIISDVYGLLVLEFIASAYLLSDCCWFYATLFDHSHRVPKTIFALITIF